MGIGLQPSQRAGLTETRDRAVDQVGLDRAQARLIELVFGHYAGRKVFDHDIGLADQVEHDVAGLRIGEVDGDASLAGIDAREVGALIAGGRAHLRRDMAHFIAFAWALDLDHVGAQVGQQPCAIGA